MNRCVWGASSVIRVNRSTSGVEFLLSAFSQSLETALKYCNYFFSSTFVVETVLKLVAFGFRRFFKDRWAHDWNNTSRASGGSGLWWALGVLRWNQLDLAIVLLSVMGIILEEIEISASLPINPTIIRIMRVLRIARGEHARLYSALRTRRGNSEITTF